RHPHSSSTTHPFLLLPPPPPSSTLFPYTTLFRSLRHRGSAHHRRNDRHPYHYLRGRCRQQQQHHPLQGRFQSVERLERDPEVFGDRKSTRLNSSHVAISYAVFCLKKKINIYISSE